MAIYQTTPGKVPMVPVWSTGSQDNNIGPGTPQHRARTQAHLFGEIGARKINGIVLTSDEKSSVLFPMMQRSVVAMKQTLY